MKNKTQTSKATEPSTKRSNGLGKERNLMNPLKAFRDFHRENILDRRTNSRQLRAITAKQKVVRLILAPTGHGDGHTLALQKESIKRTIAMANLDCLCTITFERSDRVNAAAGSKRVLRMIEKGEIVGVVFADLNRWTLLTATEENSILDLLIESKAKVFTDAQELDYSSYHGKLITQLMLGVAQYERRMFSQRMQGAKRLRMLSKAESTRRHRGRAA